ncbi:MAG: acyl carrier protein [Eubacteriales bacterium]
MQRLIKILSELHPEVEFSEQTRLLDDKILDSLDIVALVTDINEAYGTDIGAEDIIPENFGTVGDILALIKRRGGRTCP